MQPLKWYARRVRTMSPGEVLWRARSAVRDAGDRVRIPLGLIPSRRDQHGTSADRGFTLTDVAVGEWRGAHGREAAWRDGLTARGERLLANRLSFFDLEDRDCGDPPRWNYDHQRGVPTPMDVSCRIDYRDYRVTGDCKVVWEPSRHHQLVVLSRAYRATGDARFAHGVAAQIGSWIEQCPFGRGMQWRSPLELAIRTINWAWADDLIDGSNAFDPAGRARLLESISLHLWDITRKFSRGSSANNHLIGEAAGVFVGACCFPGLENAAKWRARSAAILEREIVAQTYEDGGSREQAFGYHAFVLAFFIAALLVGRRAGAEFSRAYRARLERMLEFASAMLEAGAPPTFGDADDGYVLDLGAVPGDVRDLIAIGAALFDRPEMKAVACGHGQPVRWALGADGLARFDAIDESAVPDRIEPRAFPQTGYYLLQCGSRGDDAISVLFDCGELGFGPLAAHGHADALSFTVRAFGEELLVDPGTYDYFTDQPWRQYFRSSAAHNTVVVDRCDQSVMLGPFMWGARATSRRTEWDASRSHPGVAGEHDGYARLDDPVVHRRRLSLDVSARTVTIADEIAASGDHDVTLYFHAAGHCTVEAAGANRFTIRGRRACATLVLDPALEVAAIRASSDPGGGWVSHGYHRKTPSTTLTGTCRINRDARFACRLEIHPVSAF